MVSCIFCEYKDIKGKFLFDNDLCVCIEMTDPILNPILIGSCIIIPKAHKVTVFDLSCEEWGATKQLIDRVKRYLDEKYSPDGYNVGWNCGDVGGQAIFHAHLHIIPRYSDEPFSGRGIRSWIKLEENRRPQK